MPKQNMHTIIALCCMLQFPFFLLFFLLFFKDWLTICVFFGIRYSLPSYYVLVWILPHNRSHLNRAKSELTDKTQQEQQASAERAEAAHGNKPNMSRTHPVHPPHTVKVHSFTQEGLQTRTNITLKGQPSQTCSRFRTPSDIEADPCSAEITDLQSKVNRHDQYPNC